MVNDQRYFALQQWVAGILQSPAVELIPLAGDASFRHYFRLQLEQHSLVVMDAPPNKENMQPFVAIATTWISQAIHVPKILASDLEQGFILLADFGDDLYLNVLHADNADFLYQKAFAALLQIQTCQQTIPDYFLPNFDTTLLQRELNLFVDWFLIKHFKFTITSTLANLLEQTFATLIDSALEQPQVCVHRDYHSRNLLYLANEEVGVLDFQDAVWGPITYDLVSLLRDCYIAWPAEQVEQWVASFYQQIPTKNYSFAQFLRWFDFMGIQRHLKVLGIFARLCYRDNKPNYLQYLPRIMQYLLSTCGKYPELKTFREFLVGLPLDTHSVAVS